MNKIHKYFPGFVDRPTPREDEFETLDQLLNIDWVKTWADRKDFYRFSLDCSPGENILMAEYNGGKVWWVVGFIDNYIEGLLDWVPVK